MQHDRMPRTGRGGPGRGGGRKAADGVVGVTRKNVTLDAASIETLRKLGNNDLSLGIRRAAKNFRSKDKEDEMRKITYIPVNSETGNFRGLGHEYDSHADAMLAALTDGEGKFERNDGYMIVVVAGRQVYCAGSFLASDKEAKDDVIRQICRSLPVKDWRFTTLKIERENGVIVKIDDDDDPGLLAYWEDRLRPAKL